VYFKRALLRVNARSSLHLCAASLSGGGNFTGKREHHPRSITFDSVVPRGKISSDLARTDYADVQRKENRDSRKCMNSNYLVGV